MEFDKVLRIKKASSFGLEFRTTENDGIIFYISDERNVDFISLVIKDGKVRKKKQDRERGNMCVKKRERERESKR